MVFESLVTFYDCWKKTSAEVAGIYLPLKRNRLLDARKNCITKT
ncbi:MAG: hypothetical protein U9Q69_01115 [Nanoarchaeota archaeon]|nr:hypothetical protein [Nanoarchaeota archaeon]